MTRRVVEYMTTRLQEVGFPVTPFGLFCPDSMHSDSLCSSLYLCTYYQSCEEGVRLKKRVAYSTFPKYLYTKLCFYLY